MIDVSDLIGVPYVEFGRDIKKGLDCYGLVIEVTRRMGKPLRDVVLEKFDEGKVKKTLPALNVKLTNKLDAGTIIEYYSKKERKLHIAIALDKRTAIHSTENQGVRISSLKTMNTYLTLANMYEVI